MKVSKFKIMSIEILLGWVSSQDSFLGRDGLGTIIQKCI